MSGGSMRYLYSRVLHESDFACDTPEREAFAAHLRLVAQALHDIEWVDSGDFGPGDENAAIRACLDEPLREAARMALAVLDDHVELAHLAAHNGEHVVYSPRQRLATDTETTRDALREALGRGD